jgi:HD-GYP domain-containing protein (c-di-GMP phosphodiesterase class II)
MIAKSSRGADAVKEATEAQPLAGLSVRRPGECIESVRSERVACELLTTQPHVEVMRLTVKRGGNVTLIPTEDVSETLYILSGELGCTLPSGPAVFTAGACLTSRNIAEHFRLDALTDVSLLYIPSVSQFHDFSEELGQLQKLAVEIELKDGYTAGHCRRISELSYATGEKLGLSGSRLHMLDYGAFLHDVGKIRLPLSLLNKPGEPTPQEWALIRQHPVFGRELLEDTFMEEAGKIVEQHHERFDGSGYPFGLSGSEILTEAYIVAVTDTFDAMTTDRPYRAAISEAEALGELRAYAGVHYPAEIVEAFCEVVAKAKHSEVGTAS